MADQVPELGFDKLRQIEGMTPQERFEQEVYEKVDKWLGTGYRECLKRQLRVSNRDEAWKRKMAALGRNLSLGLHVFALDKEFLGSEEFTKWKDRIWSTMFDTASHESVVNCLGGGEQSRVRGELLGPISVLTFADLVRKSGAVSEFKLGSVVADPYTDVVHRVDLIMNLGDRDIYGKELTRLIQLKTNQKNRIEIENLNGNYFFGVRPTVGGESLRRMKELEKFLIRTNPKNPISVSSFLVSVPEFESVHIRNPFGIIMTEPSELVGEFSSEAFRTGLLPKQK